MKSHLKIIPNNFTMNNVISIFCIAYFAKVSIYINNVARHDFFIHNRQ